MEADGKFVQLLSEQWQSTVSSALSRLEHHDLLQVRDHGSWSVLQDQVSKSRDDVVLRRELALLATGFIKVRSFADEWLPKVGLDIDGSPIWGFYTLIIKLLQEEKAALSVIPQKLRDISHRTGALNAYFERAPAFTTKLKEVCVEFGFEVLLFLSHAVKFLRNDMPVTGYSSFRQVHTPGWQRLEEQFESTTRRLDTLLGDASDALKVASKLGQLGDNINRQERLHSPPPILRCFSPATYAERDDQPKPPCVVLPNIRTTKFFDRVDIVQKIEEYFKTENPDSGQSLRSLALHGLGGVGKSTVALRYAEKKLERNELDALFWVRSENLVSIKQSFTDIALGLKLPDTNKSDHDENRATVLSWLQYTQCRCLIVYDNAEDPALIREYWPLTSRCQILITTRNRNFAFDLAARGLEITSWDKPTGFQFLLYLLTTDLTTNLPEDEDQSARHLADELSGHALAISAIAGLIHKRHLSFTEFGKFYNQHRNEVHRISDGRFSMLWDMSFEALDSQSHAILGVMSFLDPDSIPQAIFEPTSLDGLPEALQFCSNSFEFSGAIENLLTLALVNRDKVSRTFSLHRLVQEAFKNWMTPAQKQEAFNNATILVSMAFPRHDSTVAQLYLVWDQCALYLQHVVRLKDSFREERSKRDANPKFSALQVYCDLNNACQRYLLELNSFEELDDLIDVNLSALESLPKEEQLVDLWRALTSHKGQLLAFIGKADEGVQWLKRSYAISMSETPFNPRETAWCADNAAMAIATMNDFAEATKWHEKSRDHFREWSLQQTERTGEWPAEVMKNMGLGLLWSGHSDRAKHYLSGALEQIDSTEPYNWAMAAHVHFGLGSVDRYDRNYEASEAHFMEAQNLWRRGDQMRSDPFNTACMYRLGCVALDKGQIEAAVKHLRDALAGTQANKKLLVAEHTRCLFKLSEALEQEPRCAEEAARIRDEAERLLRKRNPNAGPLGEESIYDRLVCFLWR